MYFISFPALHITIPLIVAWFLREWKGLTIIILTYMALLIPAIVILEWHYFVDILGGIVVAGLAILIAGKRPFTYSQRPRSKKVFSASMP